MFTVQFLNLTSRLKKISKIHVSYKEGTNVVQKVFKDSLIVQLKKNATYTLFPPSRRRRKFNIEAREHETSERGGCMQKYLHIIFHYIDVYIIET